MQVCILKLIVKDSFYMITKGFIIILRDAKLIETNFNIFNFYC